MFPSLSCFCSGLLSAHSCIQRCEIPSSCSPLLSPAFLLYFQCGSVSSFTSSLNYSACCWRSSLEALNRLRTLLAGPGWWFLLPPFMANWHQQVLKEKCSLGIEPERMLSSVCDCDADKFVLPGFLTSPTPLQPAYRRVGTFWVRKAGLVVLTVVNKVKWQDQKSTLGVPWYANTWMLKEHFEEAVASVITVPCDSVLATALGAAFRWSFGMDQIW